jgi:hypothetical protein
MLLRERDENPGFRERGKPRQPRLSSHPIDQLGEVAAPCSEMRSAW